MADTKVPLLNVGRLKPWLTLAALLAATILFFWPLITPDAANRRYFAPGDFSDQFFPFHTFAAKELAAGRLALWDPYMYSGHPFQADIQTAVTYPIAFLNEWIHRGQFTYLALEWEAVSHFALAAVFTFLLVRRLTGSVAAGLLGAVTFTFSGFLTSYPDQQLPLLESTIWLPLELYCIERAAATSAGCPVPSAENHRRQGGERKASGLAAACGEKYPEATGSHRQDTTGQVNDKSSALSRRHSAHRGQSALGSLWAAFAGGCVALAVLAGHPQTVLYLAYVGAAYFVLRVPWRRWWQAIWSLAAAGGISAIQLFPSSQLFVFNHKGKLDFNFAAGGLNVADLGALLTHNPSGGTILYVGLVPLGLAVLAVFAVRRRQTFFWLLAAAVALLLSLGIHGPLFRFFFNYLPGWNLFRDQERSVVVFVMALSILAGYGLAWLLAGIERGAAGTDRHVTGPNYHGNRLAAAQADGAVRPYLAAIAAGILILASYVNLVLANRNNNLWSGDPEQDFKLGSLLAPLRADPDIFRVRISENSISHNAGNVLGLQLVSGNSPFELETFKQWTENSESGPRVTEWQLMQLTNTHYIISSRELCGSRCQPSDGIRQIGVQGKLRLFKILYPQPRAFFVTHALGVDSQREAIDGINSKDFAAEQTIFLQGTPPHTASYDKNALLRADVVGYAPGLVDLKTSSDRPAYLFTSEVAYPGWRATIDGRPVPILTADGLFRALDVAPGQHHVVFQYVPAMFFAGTALSGASLLILLCATAWILWPRQ